MKGIFGLVGAIVVLTMLGPVGAFAAQESFGQREYQNSCAACHGASGKGDGSYAEIIRIAVPPLNTLSKNNEGVFPFDRLYQIVDGRTKMKGHGNGTMPIWGDKYTADAIREHGPFLGEFYATEHIVRGRILAVLEYIHQLQE